MSTHPSNFKISACLTGKENSPSSSVVHRFADGRKLVLCALGGMVWLAEGGVRTRTQSVDRLVRIDPLFDCQAFKVVCSPSGRTVALWIKWQLPPYFCFAVLPVEQLFQRENFDADIIFPSPAVRDRKSA